MTVIIFTLYMIQGIQKGELSLFPLLTLWGDAHFKDDRGVKKKLSVGTYHRDSP